MFGFSLHRQNTNKTTKAFDIHENVPDSGDFFQELIKISLTIVKIFKIYLESILNVVGNTSTSQDIVKSHRKLVESYKQETLILQKVVFHFRTRHHGLV